MTPWYYFPGYNMTSYPQTLEASSPTKVHLAKPNHVIWSDIAWTDDSNSYGRAPYQMTQSADLSAYNGIGPGGTLAVWTDKPLGAYSGYFDGSVSLRQAAALRWATYYGPYRVGHAQPE